MQGIAAKNILGLLLNLSAFVRRQKFRADWGINNVMQDTADLIIKPAAKVGYHLADHSFGQADIDVIACKMIAAKGTPAECILGHISSSDYQTAAAVCNIKQNLCAFAGLCVFIGDIPQRRIMTDILKVLENRCFDGNIPIFGTERRNQAKCIVIGAVAGAKSWHGNGNQILGRQLQLF